MKLAKFFIATSANAAVTRRETSENDCIQTANGCMSRSTTLGELDPTILALLMGNSGDSALPLLALTGALGDSGSALPLLAATGGLGDDALPILAATGGLSGPNAAATIALAGDDNMKAALPVALMSQSAQNGGDITASLVTASLLGGDNMEANLNTAAIASQQGTPDNGLATAALLSSDFGTGANLAPLAFMGNGMNTDALLTAQALGGASGDNLNLGMFLAAQQNNNPLLTASALSGNKIDPALFFASQSNNPSAAGIALATSTSTTPEMAAIVGGASPAKVMAATGKISNENLELVALNEAGGNPFNYHLMKSQPGVGSAEALLANKVNDPLATFALTKSPILSMMTAASNGQNMNSLLPAMLFNKNGNTGNGISDASLALMAGTSGKVNPAALLLAANADNSEAGKIMQIAIQGQAGNINPMQAAYISQKPAAEVTDALIAAGIKDPATSFHASGGNDVTGIRLREGPEYITSNPGLADMAVNAAATDNKPFMGLFNTGTPTGYFASQQNNPSLAWGAAATGDPMLTYAMTKNPILSMMAGQQGNILPKEPVRVAPATGIIAGNASPSLGFALTGDSSYLMMDKLTNPANMDLALANAYNHPAPSQQDLFYGSLATDPKVAYALTGNPIIANMAASADSRDTLNNLAISNQIGDPWTSYAIMKDPKMLMAQHLGGNPLVNMAAMNSDNKLMGYALTKNPNMLFYSDLFSG
jgi:hypothetical protein